MASSGIPSAFSSVVVDECDDVTGTLRVLVGPRLAFTSASLVDSLRASTADSRNRVWLGPQAAS